MPASDSQRALAVAFLHVGPDLELPTVMVTSVRRAMPRARVVQLTDRDTPAVAGADEVIRRDFDGEHLMTYRLEHYAALPGGRYLFLDTDIVVQADVSTVFELDPHFDVALHRRESTIVRPPAWPEFPELLDQDLALLMPYNTGVMFSRNQRFWQVALGCERRLEPRYHRWFGDQVGVYQATQTEPFKVLDLHPAFNFTPDAETDDVRRAYIVHYKGPRKAWMVKRHTS